MKRAKDAAQRELESLRANGWRRSTQSLPPTADAKSRAPTADESSSSGTRVVRPFSTPGRARITPRPMRSPRTNRGVVEGSGGADADDARSPS